ncbi:MAG: hypothetical protein AMJ81_10680 [Phycisphaerae bacterium SM23_33]|nr:MAG: hypothetical protein AMJ81_10680 [Phycisphaerae bacterium SM23_33]
MGLWRRLVAVPPPQPLPAEAAEELPRRRAVGRGEAREHRPARQEAIARAPLGEAPVVADRVGKGRQLRAKPLGAAQIRLAVRQLVGQQGVAGRAQPNRRQQPGRLLIALLGQQGLARRR